MNSKFAKLDREGNLIFAPSFLEITKNGNRVLAINPKESDYLENGWYRYSDIKPEEEGFVFLPTDKGEYLDGVVSRIYDKFDVNSMLYDTRPKKYSKLKIVQLLSSIGKYQDFVQFLVSYEIPESGGLHLWDLWINSSVVEESFSGFQDYVSLVQEELELTDEQVETVLNGSTVED